MKERIDSRLMLSVDIGAFLDMLKALPLSVEYNQSWGTIVFARVMEFDCSVWVSSVETSKRLLVQDMKDWAEAFASDFENQRKGREHEIPYLLKVLLSSEQELLSCLHTVHRKDTYSGGSC